MRNKLSINPNFEKNEIFIHSFFWILYYFSVYLADVRLGTLSFHADITFFVTQNIFLFYSFAYCFKKFSIKTFPQIVLSFTRFAFVCILFLYIRVFIRHYFMPFVFNDYTLKNASFNEINNKAFIWLANYFMFASGYIFFRRSTEKEKKLRIATQEKNAHLEKLALLEIEKFQVEQAFLRAQINPHFLFNTLNFIYTETSDYSKELADSIYRLSEIMRYTLNDDININGKVPLQKEIDYIENYIELNQLRFSHQLCIHFKVDGNTTGIMIPPMILMTFLENVFKHGELKDKENPVTINFSIVPGNMKFSFSNMQKKNLLNESSTGIGIENIRKRLQYIYGDKYRLETRTDEVFFNVLLEIYS